MKSYTIHKIKSAVYRLFHPSFWFSNLETSKEYDRWLYDALTSDSLDIKSVNTHVISINGVAIWAANYPYAFGYPYNNNFGISVLPRALTRRMLKDKIVELITKNTLKGE